SHLLRQSPSAPPSDESPPRSARRSSTPSSFSSRCVPKGWRYDHRSAPGGGSASADASTSSTSNAPPRTSSRDVPTNQRRGQAGTRRHPIGPLRRATLGLSPLHGEGT